MRSVHCQMWDKLTFTPSYSIILAKGRTKNYLAAHNLGDQALSLGPVGGPEIGRQPQGILSETSSAKVWQPKS